jgi:signal transduction histidine kinase
MPDVAPPLSAFPADLQAAYPQADLLWGILEASLTGLALYTPLWDDAGQLVDFRIDLLNPAAQRMLGQPARPKGSYLEYYPHTLTSGVFAFHCQAFESGEPARYQVNYQADGLDNYFQLSARRVGQSLLVSFSDTADANRSEVEMALRARQQQEQAARAQAEYQRNQFQALVDQAPVALGFFEGPELRVMAANQQLCTMWGHPPDEVLQRPLLDALPELRGQGFDDLLRQVLVTEVPVVGTEAPAQLLRNGQLTTTYYDFVYKPFYTAAGQVQGVINVSVEVTAQVQARQQVERAREEVQHLNQELAATNEELQTTNKEYQLANTALSKAQQQLQLLNQELEARVHERTREVVAARAATEQQRLRLEQLVSQAPAGICMLVGPELVFELVNPIYQGLFPGRALQGRPLLEALPELTGQHVWQTLQQVYQTGTTHQEWGSHIPVATYEGGPLIDFYFNYVQQARYDERGHIDGVVVFVFDVTEQMLARNQVQELNEELATLNNELQVSNGELSKTNQQLTRTNVDLDNFIYTASHDLKQPIANIEGLLLALQHELPPAGRVGEVPTMLHLMQEAVERFGRTITHLTDVSRLQQAHAQPATQVSLARVVQEVQLDLAPLITQATAQVLVDIPASVTLLFAEKNLRSVIYNLLSNALKYRHPNRSPVVRLTYRAEANQQVLEVQDNGLGLDPRQGKDRLFAMFQRLHTHVEGTGLGLYMVKKMVENVGGRIEVQSELEQGATFSVYFPR